MAEKLTIIRALAVSRDLIYVVTTFEEEEARLAPSRLYQYNNGTWRFNEYGWMIQSMALYRAPGADKQALCIASANGDVLFPHDESIREVIVNRNAPLANGKRLGSINKVNQIGSHLYACGEGGQVYRRSDEGDWSILDPELLDQQGDKELPRKMLMPDGQPFAGRWAVLARHPELMDEYTRRILASDPNTRVRKLAGDTEQRMFAAVSKGRVLFWNGSAFQDVSTDSTEALTDILIEGERVLVCGRNGAFLAGNERDGFRQLPCATGQQLFTSMASYNGLIYLASNAHPEGLFVSDLTGLERIGGDLDPGISSVSTVQAVDDVLWVVGSKDIARYDGTAWTRIGLPTLPRPRKGRKDG